MVFSFMIRLLLCLLVILSIDTAKNLPLNVVDTIEKRVQSGLNSSIAVGVLDASGAHYYNFGTTAKGGPQVNEHTIYEIGSITKVFTGILLAQQVIDGTVSVDDPANQHLLPEVRVPAKGAQDITLGSLSDHTSGLPRMPLNFAPANLNNPFADYTVDQMYSFVSNYQPVRDVGTKYEYSNLAQGLLGHILALNAQMSFESLLHQVITAPLHMEETKITLNPSMQKNLATAHNAGGETENWDIPTLAGAGAIRSSTYDMLKFLAANLGYTETPLRAAMDLSYEARHQKAGEMGVGLGWHIKKSANGSIFWHNGGTGGYRAFVGFVKETGNAVVVLTNSTESVDDIGFHLLDTTSELTAVRSKDNAVTLPEEVLQRYVGRYQLMPNFHITITREASQLYGQATSQPRFELLAKSHYEFFIMMVDAQVTFQDEENEIKSLTLFQNGQELVGKKIE